MRWINWLQRQPDKLMPPPFRLLQIGSAFWQSRALYTAASLDIASVLGDEARNAETIAECVSANSDAVYRLMRMLAARGVFTEVAPRYFKNNRVSDQLRTDRSDNIRAMILLHNSSEMSRPWFEQLEQGVITGQVPFELAHGQPFYEYLDRNDEFDRLFGAAMASVDAVAGDSFAVDFDWGHFERVIDVGGSGGNKSLTILKHHPGLTALVVDRASVVAKAAENWAGEANPVLLGRLKFVAGDLFARLPLARSDKDVYFLSAILHGISDTDCVKLLTNLAYASADSGARVALLEFVLPETQMDLAGTSFDMQMFMATRGRERRLSEWQSLFLNSGWVLEERIGLRSMGTILLLRKN
ncbi:acetylserotonin O-methyltransferase [Methylomonas methanica]|nr:acetylserotonin O-methyltransferase [Methylomonas methanica]